MIFPHDALISHAWIGASVLKINLCRLALKNLIEIKYEIQINVTFVQIIHTNLIVLYYIIIIYEINVTCVKSSNNSY